MDSIYVFGFPRERRIEAPIARCGSLRTAMAERALHEAHRECLIGIRHEQSEPTWEICGRRTEPRAGPRRREDWEVDVKGVVGVTMSEIGSRTFSRAVSDMT